MRNKISLSCLLIVCSMIFTTCKKYPENTLWFKNPNKIKVINGYITEYKVNGIDSLDFLNIYYKPYIPNSIYPYNKTNRDIRFESFTATNVTKTYWEIKSDLYETLYYRMQKDKKTIRIGGSIDTIYYKKQLFLDTKGNIDWQIQYLDKKGKSKIKTTYNGNVYEITFEN